MLEQAAQKLVKGIENDSSGAKVLLILHSRRV